MSLIESAFKMGDMFKEEKIDGKLYLMARPSDEHEGIQGNLYNIFSNYFKKNKRRCRIKNEAEIYHNKDNYFVPDLMVFCYQNDREDNKIIPVIVIEVLSKSTYSKDMNIKMKKYAELGIKEYWVVDYINSTISIYILAESGKYEHYSSYSYFGEEDYDETGGLREKEQEPEIIEEFSPVNFPELKIKLEDIFYIVS